MEGKVTSEGGETRRRNRDVAHREDILAEKPVVINSANQGVNVYTQDFFGGDLSAEWSDEKILNVFWTST